MKIKNGLVFDENHKMTYKDICFEEGIITDFSKNGEYNAEDCYVLPGFIDTHIHGSAGIAFYGTHNLGDLKIALDYLSSQGVTSVLLTLASETKEEYLKDCDRIIEANDDRILGIHCEGPFMNIVRAGGMHPDKLQNPNIVIPELINEYTNGLLKIISMAPELDGASDTIKKLKKLGIKISMAHSDATFEQATIGVDNGISRATHLFNAMRPFNHRDTGIIGCALTDDRIECELICDLHHVSSVAIKLAVKSKGVDKITMVSDAGFYAGLPEGRYIHNGREIKVENGFAKLCSNDTICGSALTLAKGAENMFKLGFKPEEIAIMACVNPARASGCHNRGELKTGYIADIVILDKDFKVISVFSKGKQIK